MLFLDKNLQIRKFSSNFVPFIWNIAHALRVYPNKQHPRRREMSLTWGGYKT